MPVYFIRVGDDGPVKIGCAEDVDHRVLTLQSGNHRDLNLFRVIDGGPSVERWLHDHFRHLHIRGEWFDFDASMVTVEPPGERPSGALEPAATVVAICGGIKAAARLAGSDKHAVARWLMPKRLGGTGGIVPFPH